MLAGKVRRPGAPAPRAARGARWLLLHPARTVVRVVEPTPFGFLVALPVMRRARTRWSSVRAGDVLMVLDALARAGVHGWVAGGWGVDALLGRQTRRHQDLDVVVVREDGARQRAGLALAGIGFRALDVEVFVNGRPMPERWVMDNGVIHVELLPVDPLGPPFAGLLGEPGTPSGTIAGRPVPCLSPRLQFLLHRGYPLRDVDRHDLALLHQLEAGGGRALR